MYVTLLTSPPTPGYDLTRMPLDEPPAKPDVVPSIDKSHTLTLDTPPLVSLPIDIPCPARKWLCAMTTSCTEEPPLMAI